jgi:hypothetical protein
LIPLGPSGQALLKESRSLQREGADLYIAPAAMTRLRRKVELLHMRGFQHGAISASVVRVTAAGELMLLGWEHAAELRSRAQDLVGLADLERFLRQNVGI